MVSFPETGKIHDEFFKELIFPHMGRKRNEVVTGPGFGVDVAIVDLPGEWSMAMTSDPLSLIPTLGLKESAWLSVQLMANDMSTTGHGPQYAQFTLNLPPTIKSSDFESYWKYIHKYCDRLGIAITGGHTGRFEGQNSTVSGGGTMIAVARQGDFLTSKGARPGDLIMMTGESAMMSSSLLAMSFPETIKNRCGSQIYQQACELFSKTSVVEVGTSLVQDQSDTLRISAMHDVTEGGIIGAVYELATASDCGVEIDVNAIPAGEAQKQVCDCFGLNPNYCIGAGSMIITVHPDDAVKVKNILEAKVIDTTVLGEIKEKNHGLKMIDGDQRHPLEHPQTDPYWKAFFNAFKKGWK